MPARTAAVRVAGMAAALALGAGGTALAARAPAAPAALPQARLAVPAATAVVACPGPETEVVPDGARAVPLPGAFTVTAGAQGPGSAESVLEQAAGGAAAHLVQGGAGLAVRVQQGAAAGGLRLTSDGAGARLAAAQVTLARAGDLRGLVAGACPAAATDVWLVGGGTVPGRRGRLLLVNPTPAPAVVDVLVAGPDGPVPAPSARGLVVAPGGVRAVLVDALAPGLDRVAVHVVVRSGRVGALLHDSYLRGTTPAGVDDVVGAAPAARQAVVPGLLLAGPAPGTVRVVAPGGSEAVARVHLVGAHGDVSLPAGGVVTVPAGGVADVPLTGVAPGAYAAVVEADVPVLAGAFITRSGRPAGALRRAPGDVGWSAATAPLTGDGVTVVPRGAATAQARLLLTAPLAATVTVTQVRADGRELRSSPVQVASGTTAVVALDGPAAALALHADGPVHAAVVTEVPDPAGALVAVLPVTPAVDAARVAPPALEDPALGARR